MRPWIRDISKQLQRPRGWELLGKILAGIVTAWSLLELLRAYHTGYLSRARDQAEQSYREFLTQLGSESELSRSGALRQLPIIMTRHVPDTDHIGTFRSLGLVLGWRVPESPTYNASARAVLLNYLQLPTQRKTPIEVDALLYALAHLGESGWYDGRLAYQATENDLTWIWRSAARRRECSTEHVASVAAQSRPCANHVFDRAQLSDANFAGTILDEGDFYKANLARASFRGAHARNARFDQAVLAGSNLLSFKASGASFRSADMTNASAVLADLRNADFSNAMLHSVDFSGADLRGANFSGASLRSAKIAGADLREAILSDADLTGAIITSTRAQRTTWRRAVIDKANLSGSTFESIELLREVRSASGTLCRDAIGIAGQQCQQ